MSLELDDLRVIKTMAQSAEERFAVAATKDEAELSGEEYLNIIYETVGRLREIERLAHNYIEALISEEV